MSRTETTTTTTTTTTKAFENDYGDFSQFKKGKPTKQTLGEHIYLQYLLVSGIYMLEPWGATSLQLDYHLCSYNIFWANHLLCRLITPKPLGFLFPCQPFLKYLQCFFSIMMLFLVLLISQFWE
ncbi:hypothetical protein CRE_13828 [Caenorhabditis remanei]|uniref:Uncharacterized protein n=1 Tax=Caenorhabditis remanei TaxID=31234 RepID=E3NRL8_CAERE|nr:hypothetical protein CRE_13828 [Caenorhabditis remanei]